MFRWTAPLLLLFLCSCFHQKKQESESRPISHDLWDAQLQDYVQVEKDRVLYPDWIEDTLRLNEYLQLLSNNHPNDKYWSEEEQLAYWINAYNAFTIQIVLRNYPVESIRDIAGPIPFVNSVWDQEFIQIEDRKYSLNDIEHGILRAHFEEARIHFAINCASMSCPSLRPEAFTAQNLEEQLESQGQDFMNDPSKNVLSKDSLKLSKIFSWFEGDFTKDGSLVDFLNRYSTMEIVQEAEVEYLDYDWRLNE